MHLQLLLFWLAAAPAMAADADTLEARIRPLNTELLHSSAPNPALIAERAAMLSRLIEVDPKRALSLALPEEARRRLAVFPGAAAQLEQWGAWTGAVTELIADDMPGKRSQRRLWLRSGDVELDLHFVREPGRLKTGDLLKAQGLRLGSKVAVAAATTLAAAAATPPPCTTTGDQTTAALLVTFPDSPAPTITADDVRQALFGADKPSMDGYWRDASYGATSAKGDVFGWLTLSGSYDCDATDQLALAAVRAAQTTVDLTPYTRVFVYYPEPPGGCGWSAMGTVGCVSALQASVTWMPIADWWTPDWMVQLAIHEGGHNLGLQHADSRAYDQRPLGAPGDPGQRHEYGDPFSAMGNYPYFGHYTAQQKLTLGWLKPEQVTTVEDAGSFRLSPMETADVEPKALKIRRTANPDSWLWLEYRQPLGAYDSTLPQAAFSGALIHYLDLVNAPGGAWSGHVDLLDFTPGSESSDFLDAPLAAGQTWIDPWTARAIEIGEASSAGLSVKVSNDACVTLSPLSREHGAGLETGTITVTAPAGCQWTAAASVPWITLTSASSGAGNGTVAYQVAANDAPSGRSGALTIGRKAVQISQAPVNMPPTIEMAFPETGSGPVSSLFVIYDDPNGAEDLQFLRLKVTSEAGAADGCLLEFDVVANTVRLGKGDGTDWAGSVPLAQISALANSQCRVLDGYAGWGMLSADLAFTAGAIGAKKVYASAEDRGGLDTGWQQVGAWTVTPNQPPAAVSVTPSAGAGYAQTFTFVYSDPNGAADIFKAIVNFTASTLQCPIQVWPSSEYLTLGYSSGDSGYLGSEDIVENGYCAVNLAQSSASQSANEVRVVLALSFKPAFDGPKDCLLLAHDVSGAISPILTAGHWLVGALPGATPAITAAGMVNAASFVGGPAAPGEIVTIFGTNLGPADIAVAKYDSAGYLPFSAGDSKVFFDGIQAPIIHSLFKQVSVLVPYAVSSTTKIKVDYQGRVSNEVELPVAAAAPGIFKYPVSSQGVIVNAEDNNTFNSAEIPAQRGKIVTFFATGEGETMPPWIDGLLPTVGAWPEPVGDVIVKFGGVPGEVLFKGLIYAGVLQINVRVPESAPASIAAPLSLSIGGIVSPNDTTIALK